jgi:hypothetical protein
MTSEALASSENLVTSPVTTPAKKNPNVFIFTPMALGLASAYYCRSLAATIAAFILNGIDHAYLPMESSGIVAARNEAAREVIQNEAFSHLLFLDADMGWEPASALVEMVRMDEDFICGVYPSRGVSPFWCCRPMGGTPEPDERGLIELDAAPTGLTLIKRSALKMVADARPDLLTKFCGLPYQSWLLFDQRRTKNGEEYMTDDYGFSETFQDLGGKMWCYPDITIQHAWATINQGNFKAWIEEEKQKAGTA